MIRTRRVGPFAAGIILLGGVMPMDSERYSDSTASILAAIDAVRSESVSLTDAERDWLRTILRMPIEGVSASQLPDTFDDPRDQRRHEALDIPAPKGTPVLSAADGRLLKLFLSRRGGLMVYAADPSDRFVLLYGHLDRYADGLEEGAVLRQGQILGYVGTTGNASPAAPHLHFGILRVDDIRKWWQGVPINPLPLLTP